VNIKIVFYAIIFQIAFGSMALAEDTPIGFSGMEQIDNSSYLVVHDGKEGNDGPRLGIIKIEKGSNTSYSSIPVNDWKHGDGQANDLESVCSLPGKEFEYLLAESGYWKGKYGRIFHIKLEGGSVEILNVYQLPKIKESTEEVPKGYNFEGMVCIGRRSDIIVILGERGGSKTYRDGVLRIGLLQYEESSLSWDEYKDMKIVISAPGHWNHPKKKRSISDLHVDSDGVIWSVAAEDKGDNGPFKSVIYKAALVSDRNDRVPIREITNKQVSWIIDGFKVEALSGPTSLVKGSYMSFATEDENYPGSWRPLFRPTD